MSSMPRRLLPRAAMEALLKQANAERVAESAKDVLKEVLEQEAVRISQDAARYAMHAGRKTVKGADVKLVK